MASHSSSKLPYSNQLLSNDSTMSPASRAVGPCTVAFVSASLAMAVGFVMTYSSASSNELYGSSVVAPGTTSTLHRLTLLRPKVLPPSVLPSNKVTAGREGLGARGAISEAASMASAPVAGDPIIWLTQVAQTLVAKVLALGFVAKALVALGVIALVIGIKQALQGPEPSPQTRLIVKPSVPLLPKADSPTQTPQLPVKTPPVQLPVKTPPVQLPTVVEGRRYVECTLDSRRAERSAWIADWVRRYPSKAEPALQLLPAVQETALAPIAPKVELEKEEPEDASATMSRRALIGAAGIASLAALFKDKLPKLPSPDALLPDATRTPDAASPAPEKDTTTAASAPESKQKGQKSLDAPAETKQETTSIPETPKEKSSMTTPKAESPAAPESPKLPVPQIMGATIGAQALADALLPDPGQATGSAADVAQSLPSVTNQPLPPTGPSTPPDPSVSMKAPEPSSVPGMPSTPEIPKVADGSLAGSVLPAPPVASKVPSEPVDPTPLVTRAPESTELPKGTANEEPSAAPKTTPAPETAPATVEKVKTLVDAPVPQKLVEATSNPVEVAPVISVPEPVPDIASVPAVEESQALTDVIVQDPPVVSEVVASPVDVVPATSDSVEPSSAIVKVPPIPVPELVPEVTSVGTVEESQALADVLVQDSPVVNEIAASPVEVATSDPSETPESVPTLGWFTFTFGAESSPLADTPLTEQPVVANIASSPVDTAEQLTSATQVADSSATIAVVIDSVPESVVIEQTITAAVNDGSQALADALTPVASEPASAPALGWFTFTFEADTTSLADTPLPGQPEVASLGSSSANAAEQSTSALPKPP